jgi:hypothetical protein
MLNLCCPILCRIVKFANLTQKWKASKQKAESKKLGYPALLLA